MLSDTRPTAAEMRVMRAQAARVREQQEQRTPVQVLDVPQPVQVMAVAS